MPGPFIWYSDTFHWAENRSRGYDPDLDGPTLAPPTIEHTYDEEDWDGTDLKSRHKFDDRHPMGLIVFSEEFQLLFWGPSLNFSFYFS